MGVVSRLAGVFRDHHHNPLTEVGRHTRNSQEAASGVTDAVNLSDNRDVLLVLGEVEEAFRIVVRKLPVERGYEQEQELARRKKM